MKKQSITKQEEEELRRAYKVYFDFYCKEMGISPKRVKESYSGNFIRGEKLLEDLLETNYYKNIFYSNNETKFRIMLEELYGISIFSSCLYWSTKYHLNFWDFFHDVYREISKIKKYDFKNSEKGLATYFNAIIKNMAIDKVKERKRTQERSEKFEYDIYGIKENKSNIEKEIDKKINLEKIKELMPKIKKTYRDIIKMYYFEDYSVKEIGKKTGKKEGTIFTTLSRARNALRKELKKNRK